MCASTSFRSISVQSISPTPCWRRMCRIWRRRSCNRCLCEGCPCDLAGGQAVRFASRFPRNTSSFMSSSIIQVTQVQESGSMMRNCKLCHLLLYLRNLFRSFSQENFRRRSCPPETPVSQWASSVSCECDLRGSKDRCSECGQEFEKT